MSDEELVQRRANAKLRERTKRIFSTDPVVRADAHEALKEAWHFDQPSFDLDELAAVNIQAAVLAAMRRDTIKEVITWITKL
jgi:hypothetical protein